VAEPVVLAILLVLCGVGMAWLADWRARLGAFQSLWLVAFALYGVAVARRARWRGIPHAGAFVLVVALALRATLLPVEPTLSDDVWRYLWDGRALASGLDPYRQAPEVFRDGVVAPHVNHPELRTIYPPVAQLGFAFATRLQDVVPGHALPAWAAWKLWLLAHDLGLCALLVAWCVRRGGSPWDAAVYAWNPLVLTEYAGNAHHDPTGIFWLVLAFLLADLRPSRAVGAAIACALAVGVKLVALPAVVFQWRDASRGARVVAVALVLGIVATYVALASGPASGLAAFAGTWRHNDALFGWFAYAFGDRGARIACGLLIAGTIFAAWRERLEPVAATQLVFRAGLVLGPVVHPWYLGWLLALEVLRPSAPWLLLSCTVVLGYGAFATPGEGGAYHPAVAWRALEYGPPLLLAVALAWRRRARRRT
jgi:hypothetical protein